VILNYTNNNGTWNIIDMTNIEGVWTATIPAFPYGTNVTYVIIAEDDFNNIITSQEKGLEYEYSIIPEFSSPLIMLFFMLTTLLAAAVHRRKHSTFFRK